MLSSFKTMSAVQVGRRRGSYRRFASQTTQWPPTLRAFVEGTPIITRTLPLIDCRLTIDFGTSMLNFGATTSLCGFLMTDVLALRTLSIVGSTCGVVYNATRRPRQVNAMAWGFVFIGVNVVQIVRLLLDREEPKLSVEEAALFLRVFAPYGVEAKQFLQLMERAEWRSYGKGEPLVAAGAPLYRVHLLLQGSATCSDPVKGDLYEYSSSSSSSTHNNGSIIGATAVVDPSILGRAYPNTIRANDVVRTVSFDTRKLRTFLEQKNAPNIEAALLHLMYVDLIGGLRRDRKVAAALAHLQQLLQDCCVAKEEAAGMTKAEQQAIEQWVHDNQMTEQQFFTVLKETTGWTEEDWKEGAKKEQRAIDTSLPARKPGTSSQLPCEKD